MDIMVTNLAIITNSNKKEDMPNNIEIKKHDYYCIIYYIFKYYLIISYNNYT